MKSLTIVVVSILAIALVASFIWAWDESHPLLAMPLENRKYCVNVVTGLDLTHSMTPAEQEMARKIVCERVIPAIGPGDIFKVAEIGPRFSDLSTVVGATYEEQMPEIPEPANTSLRQTLRRTKDEAPGITSEQIHDVARQIEPLWPMVANRRQVWQHQVMAADPPQNPGSRFSEFFDGVLAQFGAPSPGSILAKRVNYLIVVGDLREEDPFGRPMSATLRASLPPDLHVLLVYPHDSEHDWNAILARWREYFKGADVATIPFGTAQVQRMLLPPNPAAGLQSIDSRGFWDYVKAVLRLDLWVVAGAVLVWLSGYWLFHRNRPTTSVATA